MDLSSVPDDVIVPLCFVGFLGFWYLICWLISRIGHWATLANEFPAALGLPVGTRRYFMRTMELGLAQYKNCLTVGVAPTGLYLCPIFLFRPGHAPILIPWTAIARGEKKKRLWLTFYKISVPMEKRRTATITLFGASLVNAIAPHLTAAGSEGQSFAAPRR